MPSLRVRAGRAARVVALVLAVAVQVAFFLVADANVTLEVDVVILFKEKSAMICNDTKVPLSISLKGVSQPMENREKHDHCKYYL